jgi:transcription elongation factor GreA
MLGPFLVAAVDPGDFSGELSCLFPGSKSAPLLAPATARIKGAELCAGRFNDGHLSMNTVPVTAAGYSALQGELEHRMRERVRLSQRTQDAIADDLNLAENSEFQAVQTEQEINETRIAELEDKLARADVIDVSKLSGDTIKFGATVTVLDVDTRARKVWQIVGEPEADVSRRKISVTSPIGRALIGKAVGASVEVEAPGGAKLYRVQKVEWLTAEPTRTVAKKKR